MSTLVKTKKKNSTLYNVLTVLVGALLMGFLWRIRGTHGWDASWGMLNAGFIFTIFIISITGKRHKIDMNWLALISLSFMLTVPAWGTLLTQISGVLKEENADFVSSNPPALSISSFSAVFLMLCLGFGLATFFGIMLGRAYSGREWKLWHFIVLFAVYYAVNLLSKAVLSHLVIKLVQPQAIELFEFGLANKGEQGSAWANYIAHFMDTSWAKKIIGGRNYFTEVSTIASAISSAAALITTRFIIKDKRSAKIGLAVSAAFAIAITISDLFFLFADVSWLKFAIPVYSWTMWEYFTGFIAGGIITAVFLKMKPEENIIEEYSLRIPGVFKDVCAFIFGYIVLIGINVVRPILERYDKSMYQMFFIIGAFAFATINIFVVCVKCGFNGKKVDLTYSTAIMLAIAMLYDFFVYMFVGCKDYTAIIDINWLHNILMCVSFVGVTAWAIPNIMKIKKSKAV